MMGVRDRDNLTFGHTLEKEQQIMQVKMENLVILCTIFIKI